MRNKPFYKFLHLGYSFTYAIGLAIVYHLCEVSNRVHAGDLFHDVVIWSVSAEFELFSLALFGLLFLLSDEVLPVNTPFFLALEFVWIDQL
jgi:hypothetical protein